jgi:hypothetical protein
MKKRLAEIVDEITSRYEDEGDQFDVKQVEEDVFDAYDAGEVIDDPVRAAIHAAVKRRDKAGHTDPDDQLKFAEFAFPRSLVIGDNERQPSRTGSLRHVLADQAVKEANTIRQNEAMQITRRRNLAVLPYLERGLTVSAAIAAYIADEAS